MKVSFIGQTVEPVGVYGDLSTIEGAARTCTQTEAGGDPGAFVGRLVERGHMSPFEFAFADFMVECDRAIQQELTRHRHLSFNIESSRWLDYRRKPLRFVTKPPEGMEVPEEAVRLLEELCAASAVVYDAMLDMGAPRDYARKALPLALASRVRVAGNLRAWAEAIPKRLATAAHPEIREVARKVADSLSQRFGDWVRGVR